MMQGYCIPTKLSAGNNRKPATRVLVGGNQSQGDDDSVLWNLFDTEEDISPATTSSTWVPFGGSGNEFQGDDESAALRNLFQEEEAEEDISPATVPTSKILSGGNGNQSQGDDESAALWNLFEEEQAQEDISPAAAPARVPFDGSRNELQGDDEPAALWDLFEGEETQEENVVTATAPSTQSSSGGNGIHPQDDEDSAALWDLFAGEEVQEEKVVTATRSPPRVILSKHGDDVEDSGVEMLFLDFPFARVNDERILTAEGSLPSVKRGIEQQNLKTSVPATNADNQEVNDANKDKIASAGGIPPIAAQTEFDSGSPWGLFRGKATEKKVVSAPDLSQRVALLRDGHAVRSDGLQAPKKADIAKAEFAPAGDIPMLIGLLTDGTGQQKENAAVSLWSLAFERPESRHRIIAESGAADLLVTHASGGTSTERELAAGVLGFLAPLLPSDVKSNAAAHGGVEALLSLIRRADDAEWTHQALIALQGFCADDSDTIRAIVDKFDGSAILTTILKSEDERNRMLADQLLEWLKSNLTELSELCQRMNEGAPLCLQLLERLRALQGSGVHSPSAVSKRLHALLVTYGEKKMVLRLVSARSLADTLADLHLELDSIGQQASTGDWQPRWKADRDAMMQTLFDVDVWSLMKTLEGAKAQEEALTLLLHEIKEKKDAYTKQQRKFLKDVLMQLAGFSSLGIPVDEKWFIPRTDVEVEDESFNGGAFGQVYYGKYMNAEVVVKSVDIKTESDRTDFLREVKVWHEASSHPNIAQLYGACHVGEPCFMVCKYISGGSLRGYLYKQQKLGRMCAWRVLLGVARGLQLLHSKGIIHADLKGDNILVEGDAAMITDFGMSFFAAETHPEFSSLGAVRWRAPEFIATKKASFEADVYSLGMCIVEAVTGKLPWGMLPDIAVQWHLNNNKFLTQPESMSDDEWALVCAMCDSDPSKRMQLAEVERQIYEFSEMEAEEEDAQRRIARAAS